MKENFLNSKTHWTLLVFVCLVGLTALRAGFSGQSAEISALEAAENRFSEEDLRFIADAESAADPEAFRARAKKLETFIYTDTGGLDARNPFCERFIDPDGNYGIYGHVLSKYLQEKFRENISTPLFADDIVGMKDSPAICPRWRSLTIGQKTKFWVWVMASIAMVESTCGHHKSTETGVRGTVFKDWRGNVVRDQNGKPVYITAIGLMQIEKERVTRAYRDT